MSDAAKNGDEYFVHVNPLERERTNFIVQCRLSDDPWKYEQLWTRKVENSAFEICCIPLYVYGLALADHITLSEGVRGLATVVKRSGHFVYHIWFGGVEDDRGILPASQQYVHEVIEQLERRDARTEIGSKHLVAVDAASQEVSNAVWDFLVGEEAALKLNFEKGL